jgi:hypothetical protein
MEGERPDSPWLCLVCGLDYEGLDDPPWGASGVDPSYSHCLCCGVEFGYGDASVNGIRRWPRAMGRNGRVESPVATSERMVG